MHVSFLGLLTIVFVCAKLFGAIAWSWWLVFLPVLILPGLVVAGFVIGTISIFIGSLFK